MEKCQYFSLGELVIISLTLFCCFFQAGVKQIGTRPVSKTLLMPLFPLKGKSEINDCTNGLKYWGERYEQRPKIPTHSPLHIRRTLSALSLWRETGSEINTRSISCYKCWAPFFFHGTEFSVVPERLQKIPFSSRTSIRSVLSCKPSNSVVYRWQFGSICS